MSLKGKLETFYLSGLLQMLSHGKRTGVLEVSDDDKKVNIFIRGGLVVHASSSQPEFRLGCMLRAKGIVPAEKVQRCLQLAAKKKQKLGRVLLEEGAISKEKLKDTLRYQITEIVNSLFLWESGHFRYRDVSFSVEGELLPQMNTMALLLQASRRIDEWSVIKKQITSDELVFKLSGTPPQKKEITLNKEEWRVLALIDGSRTVKDVVRESGLSDFAAHRIVHSLMLSRLIVKSEAPAHKQKDLVDYARIITIYNDVLQVIHKNLSTELGKRALTMFEECRTGLPPKQRRLFQDYDLTKPVHTNVQAMLEFMNTFQSLEQGRIYLRRSFNALLLSLLRKEADLVGLALTQKTLREAEQTLGYVKHYQQDSTEKETILGEIEHLMVRVSGRIEDKE